MGNVSGGWHNLRELYKLLKKTKTKKGTKPVAIIAKTVKGKGVSFMENDHHWHHGVPKGEQADMAKKELGLHD